MNANARPGSSENEWEAALARIKGRIAVDEAKAEGWDRAIAHACEMLGVPNVNWRNPYRKKPTTDRTAA